ncbi:MAG: hypothetical protein QW802_00805 [Candidatus Altiarchaeota archaeon]
MGIFNGFFGKKDKEEKVRRENLTLSEIPIFLEKKQRERSREKYKIAKPIVDKISLALKDIKKIAEEINKKEIPKEIPERERKVIAISKPIFVKEILESVTINCNTNEIDKFKKEVDICVDRLGKLLFSKGRYLPIAFSDEIEKIGKKAKEILEYSAKLSNVLGKNDENQINEIMGYYTKIKKFLDDIEEMKQRRKNLREEIERMTKKKETLEKNLNEIESGNEFLEFLRKNEEMQKINSEIEGIRSKISESLTSLKRPLKKFKRFLAERIASDKIDSYIENPVDAFILDENFEIFQILKSLKDEISAGKFILKQQEKRKIFIAYDNIYELKNLRAIFKEKISDLKTIKDEIESSEIIRRRNDITKEIELINKNIESYEQDITKCNERISELKKQILQEKKNLEYKLWALSKNEKKEFSILIDF